MKNIKPFFSICIPAYNAMKKIDDCLKSIAEQTFSNWEIIVVDDASPDNLINYLGQQSIIPRDRLVVRRLEHNRGPYYARRVAFSLAQGLYVICIDSDDGLVDGASLSKIKSSIEKYRSDVVLFNGLSDDFGTREWIDYKSLGFNEGVLNRDLVINTFLSTSLLNNLCTKAIRRELLLPAHLENAGGLRMCEDRYEVAQVLLRARSFSLLDTPIYLYKKNAESTTHAYFDFDYCRQQSMIEKSIVSMYSPSGDTFRFQQKAFLNLWADDMNRMSRGRSLIELRRRLVEMSDDSFFRESIASAGIKGIRVDRALLLWLLSNRLYLPTAILIRFFSMIRAVVKV